MNATMVSEIVRSAAPLTGQQAHEVQAYGSVVSMPLALEEKVRRESTENLNQLLADTISLRDLYKKHHWQVVGPTFYQLHLLFDKHYQEQSELVDEIAERIQALGGISIAMPHDVIELTKVARPPKDREEVPVQISRLLEAHELILREARKFAKKAADAVKDKFMAGDFVIFKGPLKGKDDKGAPWEMAAGKEYKQDDPALEGMNYLVEGVIAQ